MVGCRQVEERVDLREEASEAPGGPGHVVPRFSGGGGGDGVDEVACQAKDGGVGGGQGFYPRRFFSRDFMRNVGGTCTFALTILA